MVENPKYKHIPVRPSTFEQFRELRGELWGAGNYKSDDEFVKVLLNTYIKIENWKKKKEAHNAE
jgi:hypothetical protein